MDWESFFTHYRKPGFIPGYEIVNKLGSGVFGEVYKARKESIGKFYAIKFLKVSDEKVSEAVFKELDSLRYFAQIDHPNLVSIEDKGEVMGIPYIVMGYGGDETLKKVMHEGALEDERARAIFAQICAGVGALHEKSIIHFDLKPANVFMKNDHARVGDYGLSKLVSESRMTMSIGRGTPYYMAPEMLARKGDHRSDIYSLGVILFEMLTGEVPFTGDSEWEVLKKHETAPVQVPESVAEPFRSVILRCMAKSPDDRFQSVNELRTALEGRGGVTPPGVPTPPVTGGVPVTPLEPVATARPTTGSSRPVPPPLPRRRPASKQARKAERDVRRQLEQVAGQIKTGGTAAAGAARAADPRPLDGSFYSDFEDEGQAREARAEAPEPKKKGKKRTPLLLRPFAWLGRGIGFLFHNFLRYAIVLGITVGLAFLIHQALRGFGN